MSPAERAALDLTHKLANDGRLIEGGFAAFVLVNKIRTTDPALVWMRDAYMSGAEHLFSSIMAMFDEGSEPTDADTDRMNKISDEIDAWRKSKADEMAIAMQTKGEA